MRLGVAVVALGALVIAIFAFRPGPLSPAREIDIISSLVNSYVIPMGNLVVVSRPSDCRTDGVTKAVLEADLFKLFLDANRDGVSAFDLRPFDNRLNVETSDQSPRRLYGARGVPVVAVSRAGFDKVDALVCVEVFAREERAFFVFLKRDAAGWSVRREAEAWIAPKPEDYGLDEEAGYDPI
jgi:hypothetical protein